MLLSMMLAQSSGPDDPLTLRQPYWDFPQTTNTNGRVQVDHTLDPSERTLVIVGCGQSNIASCDNSTYNASSAKVENFNIYDGGVYQARRPLLGASAGISLTGTPGIGGCWLTRLGDKLISDDIADRVILVPNAVGATSIQNWVPGLLAYPGSVANRIDVTCKRLIAAGLTPDAIFWQQGESNHGTSQALYAGWLAEVIAAYKSYFPSTPFFVGTSTYMGGVTDSNVQAACAAAVDHGAGIWAGGNSDTLTSGYRQADDIHFDATGADACADLWKTALAAYGAPFV